MEDIIDITVLGENFSFLSSGVAEHTEDIVNVFLSELEEVDRNFSGNTIGITKLVKLLLATMNITNKYLEAENELQDLTGNLENHIRSLEFKLK